MENVLYVILQAIKKVGVTRDKITTTPVVLNLCIALIHINLHPLFVCTARNICRTLFTGKPTRNEHFSPGRMVRINGYRGYHSYRGYHGYQSVDDNTPVLLTALCQLHSFLDGEVGGGNP